MLEVRLAVALLAFEADAEENEAEEVEEKVVLEEEDEEELPLLLDDEEDEVAIGIPGSTMTLLLSVLL